MDLLELQLAEMELLQCTFEDQLKIEAPRNLDEIKNRIGDGEVVDIGFVYTLNFDLFTLWISLPDLYPKMRPTIRLSTKICDDKNFQNLLDEKIDEIVRRDTDELVVMEIISWVEENIESFRIKEQKTCDVKIETDFLRLWIYSHHIYSNEKRRNMLSISNQLGISGFILPGKPGIICVEGDANKVQQFYMQIRR